MIVSIFCMKAAVLTPIIFIYVINIQETIATNNHVAYTSNPSTVYKYPFKNPGNIYCIIVGNEQASKQTTPI